MLNTDHGAGNLVNNIINTVDTLSDDNLSFKNKGKAAVNAGKEIGGGIVDEFKK